LIYTILERYLKLEFKKVSTKIKSRENGRDANFQKKMFHTQKNKLSHGANPASDKFLSAADKFIYLHQIYNIICCRFAAELTDSPTQNLKKLSAHQFNQSERKFSQKKYTLIV
jgi:hypothetical protein